ncbi:Mth938-like domain-containing protein [Wolbachia endosymbiont of Folsomia candida]|uniref:Mth938-like domain-containing protein n=1 Tax=Wolbachia endosymbiont of Folsomia candida TaxID=169402 RepID=UPI000AA349E2|nr:Mth938-like domain-containing protein [Wolbachia endosymbiont of Folsomia candida]APR98389.1 hypothetical protein ASM33_03820 [Wolbachia endosymbiont of Folsomia candida]
MDITPLIFNNKNLINSYSEGRFLVNNREYCGSIIIFPEKVVELSEIDINNREYFERFLIEGVEILLIGTGKTRNTPNLSVKSYLTQQKGLNFEFMTTGAACRTHNVLVSEDRFVVTYLIAI